MDLEAGGLLLHLVPARENDVDVIVGHVNVVVRSIREAS
jgi:hypothetical protein